MVKLIGIDYGSKTVGLAISDINQKIAFPLESCPKEKSINRITQLLHEEDAIEALILGIPKALKGNPTPMTEEVLSYKKELSSLINIPIYEQDERLISKFIDQQLSLTGKKTPEKRKVKDALEASIILQAYLDKKNFLG